MAAPTKQATEAKTGHTFRKYKDGDYQWHRWQDQIFTADATDKCPTYVTGRRRARRSCPSGEDIRGWLNIVRAASRNRPKAHDQAGIRLPPRPTPIRSRR